ncbi:hypothetical protein L211DRAFT_866174 [Terfezia boudieri ATCC MYA-4762]|uniref:Uncharacterized protein n=1 Tax=Terfezia boudieri ATCC MYA-4762 TaxID=1051890 RepID=A0A3N4LV62_9PEZI|nr:hypothetical protein L211DRAFT_866174 [Terfezia boudieri ATCC MYA-4762]
MLTIRPYSEFIRRIAQVSSSSTSAITTQFCVAEASIGNRANPALRHHSKSPLHRQKRDYHGPTQKPIASTESVSSMDPRPSILLSGQSTRSVHGSNLDLTRLSNDFPDSNLWYVLTAIALTAVGRQHLVGQLWVHLAGAAPDQQEVQQAGEPEPIPEENLKLSPEMEQEVIHLEQVAMRLREGLMKMSVLFGYPRAINALSTLYKSQQQLSGTSTPRTILYSTVFSGISGAPHLRPYLCPSRTDKDEVPVNNYSRGLDLLTKLYSPKHVPNLLHNMSISSAGDLSNFAVSRIYGDLLSDVSILNERETGLACFVTCLALALGAGPKELGLAGQIKGHMYGARNLGASGAEVRGATDLALRVWENVTGESIQDVPNFVNLVLEKAKDW